MDYIKLEIKFNIFELFKMLKNERYPIFLDSGMDPEKLGMYSFIAVNPFLIIKSKNESISIFNNDIEEKLEGNPFDILERYLELYKNEEKSNLPFTGGAAGYFAYDLCHHIEKLPRHAVDDVNIPDMFVCFYDSVIIADHRTNELFITSNNIKNNLAYYTDYLMKRIDENKNDIISENESDSGKYIKLPDNYQNKFKSNFTKENYIAAIKKIKDYIRSGDIYQANMTQRFETELKESPFDFYCRLRKINRAPFASYLDFGEGVVVSSSPERFIKIKDRIIETRPIKGTRPRGKTPEEDLKNRTELLESEKDKAELLMIVDLERNDLGKVSKTGTVKVTELFHLEEYPTVYHLVSTVIGEMCGEYNVVDVLKAVFPGGSITGAPKIRAMEIIDELEPTQRNIYTGSIGYIGFNGDTDLNIVIRTVLCKDNKAYFQVGGGIVWDSDPELEYEETLHKANPIMRAIGVEL